MLNVENIKILTQFFLNTSCSINYYIAHSKFYTILLNTFVQEIIQRR